MPARNTLLAVAAGALLLGIAGWATGLPTSSGTAASSAVAAIPAGSYIDASGDIIEASPAPTPSGPAALPVLPGVEPGWIAATAKATAIPLRALQAYAGAALAEQKSAPQCRLSWNTLGAIGFVESGNGTHDGAFIGTDGTLVGRIVGPALDGSGGSQRVRDTDKGALDGDSVWDHAVGPMQFLPATWARAGVDGSGDGKADPNQIDDAALTAAQYLCADGRDLSTAEGWKAAVLSYNDLESYAETVRDQANLYAQEAG